MTAPLTGPALRCVTGDADGTRALAGALARLCVPGDIVLLAGDLGAGKTVFAQGFGLALGVDEAITSPTFALVRQYQCGKGPVQVLLHADVYRLDHLQEIVDLGLGELVEEGGVAVVEWGDVAEPVLGSGSLRVDLLPGRASDQADEMEDQADAGADQADAVEEDTRSIAIEPIGRAWDERWRRVAAAVAPWAAPQ